MEILAMFQLYNVTLVVLVIVVSALVAALMGQRRRHLITLDALEESKVHSLWEMQQAIGCLRLDAEVLAKRLEGIKEKAWKGYEAATNQYGATLLGLDLLAGAKQVTDGAKQQWMKIQYAHCLAKQIAHTS